MKTLYKFILEEETGKITVKEISTYEDGKWRGSEVYWRFKGSSCWMYVYEKDLNKFKSGHVYSFDPSVEKARKIIRDTIGSKVNKAQAEVDRWTTALEKIHD